MHSDLPIVIVGTGGVARSLSIAFKKCGLSILGIVSRGGYMAEKFCKDVEIPIIHYGHDIAEKCICIIAVPDSAIAVVVKQLNLNSESIIVHTAGSVDASILASSNDNYGVIYPLQTFHASKIVDFSQVNVCIEGNNPYTTEKIKEIVNAITPNVFYLDRQQRLILHLSAVFACNFSNLMYSISHKLLCDNKIDYKMLHSLIIETATKATLYPPSEIQTGPAARNDIETIKTHLSILDGKLGELYTMLSDIIRLKQITLK